jgi:hypothetical protein
MLTLAPRQPAEAVSEPLSADFPEEKADVSLQQAAHSPVATDSAVQTEADPWWLADLSPAAARQPESVLRETRPLASPASGVANASVFEQEQAAMPPRSRLDGLRGKSFQQGFKNLRRRQGVPEEPTTRFSDPVHEPESSAAPTASATTPEVSAASRPEKKVVPSKHRVTAEPELLPPPREYIPIRDETAEAGDDQDRRDRRDPYDEVNILPSWRGQYRKKS